MRRVEVAIQRLPGSEDLPLPQYMTPGAAGMDVAAAVLEPVVLRPGGRMRVPTGLAVAVPEGFEMQIRPRSGLAAKHGITALNSPGTIDSDYRGEIQVLLANLGDSSFTIHRGDRIAQLVLAPVYQAEWAIREELPDSGRGAGGFGHTGHGHMDAPARTIEDPGA